MNRRAGCLAAVLATASLVLLGLAASASAAPVLEITSAANTAAAPGGTIDYFLNVINIGDQATSGNLTIKATLPPGLTADSASDLEESAWDCSAFVSELTCTLPEVLEPRSAGEIVVSNRTLRLTAAAGPGTGTRTARFDLFGDGTVTQPDGSPCATAPPGTPCASIVEPTRITAEPLGFGIDDFDQQVTDAAGAPSTEAAGHPANLSTQILFNTADAPNPVLGETFPVQSPRDAVVELPPGLLGDPASLPTCSAVDLSNSHFVEAEPLCPAASQVGVAAVVSTGGGTLGDPLPVFNMQPPTGAPARFGFNVAGSVVSLDAGVRSGGDYGLSVTARGIPQGLALAGTRITFWGVPADPSHDADRACPGEKAAWQGGAAAADPHCAVKAEELGLSNPPYVRPPLTAFFRNPTSCTAAGEGLTTTLQTDSWPDPGDLNPDGSPDLTDPAWKTASTTSHQAPSFPSLPEEWGEAVGITGCNEVPFEPEISVAPTTNQADSPTGLNVNLSVPQNALTEPEAIAQSDLKGAVVKLPPGMTVNPAQAGGLGGCTEAEIDLHGENTVPTCPDSSKIGAISIKTPLLEHPIEGAVYLATQNDNPFHSLLALYLVGDDKAKTGTVIKLAGKVNANPQTGQLETVFTDQPQLPFEELSLELFGGAQAALINPPTCGTYAAESSLSPWSGNSPAQLSSKFTLTAGPSGSACPPKPAAFAPKLTAGTQSPIAAAFSPFSLRLTREDASQRLTGLSATLPPGLLGKLAGIPYCPDAALAAVPTAEGTAAAQIASPSCPAASQVGVVTVGAGAGPNPFYLQTGKAYLAGPYKGAPLSLAIVTPALAGPFDLGNVLVRTALQVNPETTQITAVSDPLPQILDGIPLDLRDLRVDMNRPNFTLNPTSCDPMSVGGTVSGSEGATAPVSNRFQVSDCARLGFKPRLAIKLKGGTRRNQNPALRAVVSYPKGNYANIAKASVALPHSEFLDQSHIRTICTRVQFAAGAGNGSECPKASIYGFARASTPLLDHPVEGPVYLRSSSHNLPDLVAALGGQISVDLDGRIDTDKQDGIRNSFEMVPDAPVSKFVLEMQGGKKGLLVNSENICKEPQHAIADFTGQNGKIYDTEPLIANSCKGRAKGKKAPHRTS